MKKNTGKQAVINYIGQHPGCLFNEIRHATELDPSVVNSALWQMNNKDGQVKREGECRHYRYTLTDQATVTKESDLQFLKRPGGVNPMTNLFNQCLAGVRK